jgi:UDP-N-acetylmuramyl tripeptide synthase
LADWVYLTSDNPRTEDAGAILEDMLEGVPADAAVRGEGFGPTRTRRSDAAGHPRVIVIADRGRAIARCIQDAESNDTVLVAGKGHEDYQIVGCTKRHFDDREHAAAALARWEQQREAPCPQST